MMAALTATKLSLVQLPTPNAIAGGPYPKCPAVSVSPDFPPISDAHLARCRERVSTAPHPHHASSQHQHHHAWRPVLTQSISESALLVRSALPGAVSVLGMASASSGAPPRARTEGERIGLPMKPQPGAVFGPAESRQIVASVEAQHVNTSFPLPKMRRSVSGFGVSQRQGRGLPQQPTYAVLGARPGVAFPPISPPRPLGAPAALGSMSIHVVGHAASLPPAMPPKGAPLGRMSDTFEDPSASPASYGSAARDGTADCL